VKAFRRPWRLCLAQTNASGWLSAVAGLADVHERRRRVVIENQSANTST
jgi:hypothetical protein